MYFYDLFFYMDIKTKLRKQQIKLRLARMKYSKAKGNNEPEFTVAVLYAKWSQLNFICNLWAEAVATLQNKKEVLE